MTRRLPAVVLALALTACSGGGGGRPDAPEQPDPKEAYVAAATEICSDADAEFAALPQPATPEAFGPYVAQTVQLAERVQTDLAALTPPPEDRAELESKVLTPFAAVVEEGKAYSAEVTAAGTDQARLLPLLGQMPSTAGIDTEYLRSYGLASCADAIERVG